MKFLSGLGIVARLYLVCGVLVAALAVVSAAAWMQLQDIAELTRVAGASRVGQLGRIAAIELDVTRASLQVRHAMLVKTPADLAATLADIGEKRRQIEASVAGFKQAVFTPAGREAIDRIEPLVAEFWSVAGANVRLIEQGRKDEAFAALVEKTIPTRNRLLAALESEKKRQGEALAHELDTIRKDAETTRLEIAALVGFVAVLLLAAVWYIGHVVRRRVAVAQSAAGHVRDGDLTQHVVDDTKDEFSPLIAAMADMRDSLARVVGGVRAGVDSVTTASSQIAAGNQDLSSRTEQQASSLQETAASMEQLTSTVRQSADNARQASQLAQAASAAAGKGGTVVGQVVATMDEITASSRKIADIIGVIDGIAFQTNILALNAAVEAARAGEQGRGFAVVAGEVRNLAQRSAQAAREIKDLIGSSVEKVDAGSQLVHAAGEAMNDIVGQVQRVNDLIAEITAAAVEQSSGISQVNTAVTQMDQTTQQNAALVEQSAAAARSLQDQADSLSRAVSVFKLLPA